MKQVLIKILQLPLIFVFIPIFLVLICYKRIFIQKRTKPNLAWGPIPIISNKFWSLAMKQNAYHSFTIMESYYGNINAKEDFDFYFQDYLFFASNPLLAKLFNYFTPYFVFLGLVTKIDILHFPFSGGLLFRTALKPLEPLIYKLAQIKCIVIPYGADFYQYSTINDNRLKQALLISYPDAAKREKTIKKDIERWVIHADCIVGGFHLDGLGRWDILPFVPFIIDVDQWNYKLRESSADGIDAPINIIHCSNHNGFKGTEFIVRAIDQLLEKGFKINFKVLKNIPNDKIKTYMEEADILVEQVIANAYSLNAIEGMATGLPVIANVEGGPFYKLFNTYSYAGKCPIVSASTDNLTEVLEHLVTKPSLRKSIGLKSRDYVLKFHSYEAGHFMFKSIYDKIWHHKTIDLINLYHPILGQY